MTADIWWLYPRRSEALWSCHPPQVLYLLALLLLVQPYKKLTQKRHAVMYRNHGQRCALKFSDYGTAAGDGGHRYDRSEHVLLFDTVHPVRLDGYQLLFSLRSSDFYVLNVLLDADGKVLAFLCFFF